MILPLVLFVSFVGRPSDRPDARSTAVSSFQPHAIRPMETNPHRPAGAHIQIAVLTFGGFNELDSFVAAAILNRLKVRGWAAYITCDSGDTPFSDAGAESGLCPRFQGRVCVPGFANGARARG